MTEKHNPRTPLRRRKTSARTSPYFNCRKNELQQLDAQILGKLRASIAEQRDLKKPTEIHLNQMYEKYFFITT